MQELKFSGAVLAGGRSSRMGKDKAGLTAFGSTFLELQLEKLRSAGIEDLIVSLPCKGEGQKALQAKGARAVFDSAPDLGPLEGIRAALSACENEYCFILSVDSVLVKTETVSRLCGIARDKRSAITILSSERGPEPLTGVYSKEVLAEVSNCLEHGKRAVKSLFEAFPPMLAQLSASDPQLFNCNTPEDYERFIKEHHE